MKFRPIQQQISDISHLSFIDDIFVAGRQNVAGTPLFALLSTTDSDSPELQGGPLLTQDSSLLVLSGGYPVNATVTDVRPHFF